MDATRIRLAQLHSIGSSERAIYINRLSITVILIIMTNDTSSELVNVPVPRRFYPLIIQTLAIALAAESNGSLPSASSPNERAWTSDEIRHLRRVVPNGTVEALMELTCASPKKRVTFQEVYEHSGRTFAQARADLAGFTRLVRKSFGRERWPVNVVQGPDKGLTYDAEPAIAEAWNNTRP